MLDGFELAAKKSWEQAVLPARLDRYEPELLDTLCLTGEAAWARLSRPSVGEAAPTARLVSTTPIALFAHDHVALWQTPGESRRDDDPSVVGHMLAPGTERVPSKCCRGRGALFLRDLAGGAGTVECAAAIGDLIAAGLVTSDSLRRPAGVGADERRRPRRTRPARPRAR